MNKTRETGRGQFQAADRFWEKLNGLPAVRHALAPDVRLALEKTLPDLQMEFKVVRRQAGLDSLGQRGLVAIGEWQGGCVAREAKAMLPSACVWLSGEVGIATLTTKMQLPSSCDPLTLSSK